MLTVSNAGNLTLGGQALTLLSDVSGTTRAVGLLYKARVLSVDDRAQSLRIGTAIFYKLVLHSDCAYVSERDFS